MCIIVRTSATQPEPENIMKYLVNVKVSGKPEHGCFSDSFNSLDEVREFAKASAASFRRSMGESTACELFMMKNGTTIADGRTLAC